MNNPFNDKKAETILRAFTKYITTHNAPDWLQTDNGREFKMIFLRIFVNQKVLLESMENF